MFTREEALEFGLSFRTHMRKSHSMTRPAAGKGKGK